MPRSDVRALGYAGLLPFVGLAAVAWLAPDLAERALDTLELYAFGIVAFLLGSWWGQSLLRPSPATSVLSNGLFLLALAALLFTGRLWLPICAVLLVLVWVAERHLEPSKDAAAWYRGLRLQLSVVAAVSLLAAYLSLLTQARP